MSNFRNELKDWLAEILTDYEFSLEQFVQTSRTNKTFNCNISFSGGAISMRVRRPIITISLKASRGDRRDLEKILGDADKIIKEIDNKNKPDCYVSLQVVNDTTAGFSSENEPFAILQIGAIL